MAEYKGYRAYGAYVLNCCRNGEVVTTEDMRDALSLDESQVALVKREARKIAAKWGWLWSYDPDVNGYRVCPDGDEVTAARMTAYSYRASAGALKSTELVVAGAYAGGLTTRRVRDLRRNELVGMMDELKATAKEIEGS